MEQEVACVTNQRFRHPTLEFVCPASLSGRSVSEGARRGFVYAPDRCPPTNPIICPVRWQRDAFVRPQRPCRPCHGHGRGRPPKGGTSTDSATAITDDRQETAKPRWNLITTTEMRAATHISALRKLPSHRWHHSCDQYQEHDAHARCEQHHRPRPRALPLLSARAPSPPK